MPSPREEMETWSLRQVFDSLSNSASGTPTYVRALAEIQRRAMDIERASLAAQRDSATAASAATRSANLSAMCAVAAVAIALLSLLVSAWSALHR
jgi:hypothetical protein